MKKLLLIPLLFMSLVSSPSRAASIEILYESCKPYQSNGFKVQTTDDAICITYFSTLLEVLNFQCQMSNIKEFNPLYPNRKIYSGVGPSDTNKVITSFINWAENNTDKWAASPANLLVYSEYLTNKFPCKSTN